MTTARIGTLLGPPRVASATSRSLAIDWGLTLTVGAPHGLSRRPCRSLSTPPTASGAPTFTHVTDWTFPELTRAIEAGEVVGISVATRGSVITLPGAVTRAADGELVAKTVAGSLVLIQAGIPAADAFEASSRRSP